MCVDFEIYLYSFLMVVGSVLTASPPYAPGSTNTEFPGATPGGLTSRSYTYTSGPAADGLGLSRSYTYSSGFGVHCHFQPSAPNFYLAFHVKIF